MSLQFHVIKKEKGESRKTWLICWTYKEALAQALYRTRLSPEHEWGVRVVTLQQECKRAKWLRENPNATSNQIYNFAPARG